MRVVVIRRRVWLIRCAWQGLRARRRGDFDLGVNGPHGREILTRGEVEALAAALASGRVARRKARLLPPDES